MTDAGPVGGNSLDLALLAAPAAAPLLTGADGAPRTSASACCRSTTIASSRPS